MSKLELHSSFRSLVGGCALNALTSQGRRNKLIVLGLASASLPLITHAQDLEVLETFSGQGQGESRATNSIDLETLEIAQPGISAEKIVDRLPGVNVVTRDPFGFYEFGNDIRVRAFNITNLGVTLDGIPTGTSSPRYGTPVNRVFNTNNLKEIVVSQGAGDVTTPAYQALGGSLAYFSVDPTDEQGIKLVASYGDFDHISLFGRFNTGEILPGLTAWVSTSHFEFSPRGLEGLATGEEKKFQTKVKYELPSGKGSIKFAFTFNDRDDFDTAGLDWNEYIGLETGTPPYPGDTSADVFAAGGYKEYTPFNSPSLGDFDFGDLSDEGRNYGPPKYIDPTIGPGEGVNAVYYDLWRNGRMDWLYSLTFDYEFSEELSVNFIPYYHDKQNYGLFGRDNAFASAQVRAAYAAAPTRTDIWAQPWYDASGNPLDVTGAVIPTSEEYTATHALVAPGTVLDPSATDGGYVPGLPGRTGREEIFGGDRLGATVSFTYATENNELVFGGWYEEDTHFTERPNYNLVGGGQTSWFDYDQFNFMNYTRDIDQSVYQLWVKNKYTTLDGKLDLIAGIKAINLTRDASGFLSNSLWIANTLTERSTEYEDLFLPQLGALYRLNDSTEIFFNYSENMATPDSGTITTAGDTFNPNLLNPEYSENFDLGVRGSIGDINYTAQAYYIQYTDRILASAVPFDVGGAAAGNSVFQNVGGVDSWGAEVSADWLTPIEGLKIIASIAIQESTFQEDVFKAFYTSGDIDAYLADNFGSRPDADGLFYLVANDNASAPASQAFLAFEALEGKDLGNSPFLTANFDAIYTIEEFRFSFSGKYFDEVQVNTWNTQPVDGYTLFEAGVRYKPAEGSKLEGLSFSFNVYNLFDQYFWLARSYGDDNGQVLADRGRQFTFTVTADF